MQDTPRRRTKKDHKDLIPKKDVEPAQVIEAVEEEKPAEEEKPEEVESEQPEPEPPEVEPEPEPEPETEPETQPEPETEPETEPELEAEPVLVAAGPTLGSLPIGKLFRISGMVYKKINSVGPKSIVANMANYDEFEDHNLEMDNSEIVDPIEPGHAVEADP